MVNTKKDNETKSNYEKLLIKICMDFEIDNYEEVIRKYTKIKNWCDNTVINLKIAYLELLQIRYFKNFYKIW